MGKITTEGAATRRAKPDRMILTLCFFQRSADVDRTVTDAHTQCERFLDALTATGFPLKQIRLSGDELGRTYDETPQFVANRTVELRTKPDLPFCTWVYELIRREKFSATCSVRFELSAPEKLRRELLTEAFADARARAELLVAASGAKITGVDTIGGDTDDRPAPMLARAKGANFEDFASPTPLSDSLQAAEIECSEHVRVTWLFE